MATRTPVNPQVQQDVRFSNNLATVLGLLGIPINQYYIDNLQPGGVLFLDKNTLQWDIMPLGGMLSGTPDNAIVTMNPNEPQFNYRFQGGV